MPSEKSACSLPAASCRTRPPPLSHFDAINLICGEKKNSWGPKKKEILRAHRMQHSSSSRSRSCNVSCMCAIMYPKRPKAPLPQTRTGCLALQNSSFGREPRRDRDAYLDHRRCVVYLVQDSLQSRSNFFSFRIILLYNLLNDQLLIFNTNLICLCLNLSGEQ